MYGFIMHRKNILINDFKIFNNTFHLLYTMSSEKYEDYIFYQLIAIYTDIIDISNMKYNNVIKLNMNVQLYI